MDGEARTVDQASARPAGNTLALIGAQLAYTRQPQSTDPSAWLPTDLPQCKPATCGAALIQVICAIDALTGRTHVSSANALDSLLHNRATGAGLQSQPLDPLVPAEALPRTSMGFPPIPGHNIPPRVPAAILPI